VFCGKRFELPTGLHASGRKVGAQLGSGGLMNLQPAALPTEVGRRVLAELARSELVVAYVRDFRELVANTGTANRFQEEGAGRMGGSGDTLDSVSYYFSKSVE
jgi:hypothetical protein